jgi:DNA-binding response OmpR family regulator
VSHILIVEDERAIANLVRTTLLAEGHTCKCVYDGQAGVEAIDHQNFDLILLDLMLPEISGYELLDYLRPKGTPVIVISAMAQVDDRIRGLKMGADDYLCKPFQVGELVARVESVLRRTGRGQQRLALCGVELDLGSHMVWKEGRPVELTPKEFDLLVAFFQHKNVALTREFLYESVWQEEYTGETRTLDSHVQRLRRKLDWNDRIKTVFRIGYRLEVPR